MKSLASGTIILTVLLIFVLSGVNLKIFFNLHSITLVFAGTLGIFFFSTPPSGISSVASSLLALLKSEQTTRNVNEQLIILNRKKDATIEKPHVLVNYAQELWEKGIEPEMFQSLLLRRAHDLNSSQLRVVSTLRNLAKYPPALGMIGTVVGLVSLFSNLTASNKGQLGPSLALAMTATFYGLTIANMLIMPLSDRIQIMQLASGENNQHICKIILMIHQGEGDSVIKDEIYVAA
jgi:chemotaxis protein MotA